jgi:hypothetical protein
VVGEVVVEDLVEVVVDVEVQEAEEAVEDLVEVVDVDVVDHLVVKLRCILLISYKFL